jgi:uncharacterized protein (TIGR03067 family)
MKAMLGLVGVLAFAAAVWSEEVAAKLAGEWHMVTGEAAGQPPPEEVKNSFRFKFAKDGNFSIKMAGPDGQDREIKGTYKLKPDTKPLEIDMTEVSGENKRESFGILELNGDQLKICLARQGNVRPTEFSGAKSGYLYLELKRVK